MKIKTNLILTNYNLKSLLLIIFLIPFTDTKFLPLPGEFNTDLALNLALVITILHICKSLFIGKYYFVVATPLSLLYLFIGSCFLSTILNFDTVIISNFKGRNGLVKFIWQGFILMFLGFFYTNYLMGILSKINFIILFKKIRRVILKSYLIVFLYAMIEFCYIKTNYFLFEKTIDFFDFIFLLKHSVNLKQERLSSLMHEPPFLAIYLVFVVPWILSYLFEKKYIIALSPVLLGLISGSRTSLLISIIQLLLFGYYFFKIKYNRISFIQVLLLVLGLTIVFYLFNYTKINTKIADKIEAFSKKSKSIEHKNKLNISNVSRWGTQSASLAIWKEYPIFGVGFSQQGFFLKQYYKKTDYDNSYEIRSWSDTNYPTWPPGFSIFTRLLAETGFVGLVIFLFFLITILRYSYFSLKINCNPELKIMALVLFVCNISFVINYMQFDSFRLVSFWITVALTLTLYKILRSQKLNDAKI